MKKTLILSLGLLAICFSCKQKELQETASEKIILSENIEYDVVVNNYKILATNLEAGINHFYTLKDDLWYILNIESSSRIPFVGLLFEKALNGELELTDMDNNPLSTTAVKELLFSLDSMTYFRAVPPYDMFDTIIELRNYELSDITAFRFREQWTYDTETMAISKKVLAMAPIASPDKDNDDVILSGSKGKPLFWINFPVESVATQVLTERIITHVPIFGEDDNKAINADTVKIQTYLSELLSKIESDKITAYFAMFIGGEFEYEAENGKELVEKVNSFTQENKPLTDLRFMEEWTFDPNTMCLQKNVVGFCLVAKDYHIDGQLRGFLPLFWVYFDDIWMPYGKKIVLP